MGVYIDNKSVLFKTCFSRKATCVEEIVAIKIERAIQKSINWPAFYLKDNRGNQLFEMIAVSKYDADMLQPARGHTDFIAKFKEHVLFFSIYDQSVIDYLLTLNPNIIVF